MIAFVREVGLLLNILMAGALAVAGPAPAIDVSVAVRSIVAKYGKQLGPDAERELAALSDAGDSSAAALLGEIMRFPDRAGGPDFVRACDFSTKAPVIASAVHNVATCYFTGQGRTKDLAQARVHYARAAEMGMAMSKCALGNMLITGIGGPADPARGIALCREAADAGDPDAQTDYGGYLLTSKYVPKDALAARRYLFLAAEKGQRNAAFLLGQIYWNGDGVEKNVPQAAVWWITAYEGGRKDAAFLIGNAASSLIVEAAKTKQPVADVVIDQAKKWLNIAEREDPDPKKRLDARKMLGLLEQLLANRAPVR